MKQHKVKLVVGDNHSVIDAPPADKKQITTLTMGYTKKELAKMKSVTGLQGDVSPDQIIKTFIKLKLLYGN